jgi:hypothetical protein
MALQAAFSRARRRVLAVAVRAEVHLDRRDGDWTITRSDLECEVALERDARTRDMFASEFDRVVEEAAANCPVSRAIAGVEITVDARQANSSDGSDAPQTELLPIDDPHGERVLSDGRQRRALEGQLVSRIRTQARRRRGSSRDARQAVHVPPPPRPVT